MPSVDVVRRRDMCINQLSNEPHSRVLFDVRPSGENGVLVVLCETCLRVLVQNATEALKQYGSNV